MEDFRLKYPLTSDALVVDLGAFRGDFVDWCRSRWDCRVRAYEPCREFADAVARRFVVDPKVRLLRYGLSDRTEWATLSVHGDSTSVHDVRGEATEVIRLKDVAEEMADPELRAIDLLKVNIEGGEYPLLDRMIETGLTAKVRFLQVQFHSFGSPDPAAARDRIRAALAATHREEWCVNGGQWESWARID